MDTHALDDYDVWNHVQSSKLPQIIITVEYYSCIRSFITAKLEFTA